MFATADSPRTLVPVNDAVWPQTIGSNSLRGSLRQSLETIASELEDSPVMDSEGAPSGPIVFSGHMRMEVPNPQTFLSDADAQNAVREGISRILGLRSDFISLEASWSGSILMMSADESAKHIDRAIDIDYSAVLQPHHFVSSTSLVYMVSAQATAEMSSTIQEELRGAKGQSYIVKVLEHKVAA